MRCLNKSLPYIQEILKVVPSESAVSKIIGTFPEDYVPNIVEMLSVYQDLLVKAKAYPELSRINNILEKERILLYSKVESETAKKVIQDLVDATKQKFIAPWDAPNNDISYFENKLAKIDLILLDYGYNKESSGVQNVVAILSKIKDSSDNSTYRFLASLFLGIQEKTGYLNNVNFEIGDVNEYDNITNTITLSKNNPNIKEDFQYTFLHELLHKFTVNKIADSSEQSVYYRNRIKKYIAVLEKNLVREANKLGVEDSDLLRSKLELLRAKKKYQYKNELERSLLNGLIDEFEFINSIMLDKTFQQFANRYTLDNESSSIKEQIISMVSRILDTLKEATGLKIKEKGVLKSAVQDIFEIVNLEDVKESQPIKANLIGTIAIATAAAAGVGYLALKKKSPTVAKQLVRKEYIEREKELLLIDSIIGNNSNKIAKLREDGFEKHRGEIETLQLQNANLREKQAKIQNEWSNQVFSDIAKEALDSVEDLLTRSEIDESEVLSAAETIKTFKDLLSDYIKNGALPDVNGEIEPLDPSLVAEMTNLRRRAIGMEHRVVELAQNQIGVRILGSTASNDELFRGQIDSSKATELFLDFRHSAVNLTRKIGYIINTATVKADHLIDSNKKVDDKQLSKFLKKFKFSDILRFTKSKDIYGNDVSQTEYLSRYYPYYYNKRRYIIKNHNHILSKITSPTARDFQIKIDNTAKDLAKIQFVVDIRYMFSDEYGELRGIKNLISEARATEYLKELKATIQFNFGDLGEVYVESRFNQIVEQAKQKYDTYKRFEQSFVDNLKSKGLPQETIEKELHDYRAYNHPFLYLDEFYDIETGTNYKISKYTPSLSTPSSDGKVQYVRYYTPEGKKVRNASNFLIIKARRKESENTFTGFYDENFLAAEKQKFEHPDSNDTLMDFLNWAIETEKKYTDMFPNYLRSEKMYYHMVDITKDLPDILNESEIFTKVKLAPHLIKDAIVDNVSRKMYENEHTKLDILLGDIKKYIQSIGLQNKLNKQGRGDQRLIDPEKYFDIIRKAALKYQQYSTIENLVRLAQYIYSNPEGVTFNTYAAGSYEPTRDPLTGLPIEYPGTKTGVNDKAIFDRHIDFMMYGVRKTEFGSMGVSSKDTHLKYVERKELQRLRRNLDNYTSILDEAKEYPKFTIQEKSEFLLKTRLISQEMYDRFKKGKSPLTNLVDQRVIDLIERTEAKIDETSKEINRITTSREMMASKVILSNFNAFLRLKLLAFSPYGRFIDYFQSNIIGNSRLLSTDYVTKEGLAKAHSFIMPMYGMNALIGIGSVAAFFSGAGLTTTLAMIAASYLYKGRSIQGLIYDSVANLIGQEQKALYLKLILEKFGLTESVDFATSGGGYLSIPKAVPKPLNPMGLLEAVEYLNQGTSTLAVIASQKIEDKTGKLRSLLDAYIIKDNTLVWNTEEFEPDYEAGSQKLADLQHKVDEAKILASGNYSEKYPVRADVSHGFSSLIIMARFIPEAFAQRFSNLFTGNPITSPTTERVFTGWYGVLSRILRGQYKEEEYEKTMRNLLISDVTISATMILMNILIIDMLIDGSDDEDKKVELETWRIVLYNMFIRAQNDQLRFQNPAIWQQMMTMRGLHPYIGFSIELNKLMTAVDKIIFRPSGWTIEMADNLSSQEMSSRHINKDEYKVTGRYPSPKDAEKADRGVKVKRYKHYNVSRVGEAAKKLFPGTSAWESSKNLKEEVWDSQK